MTVHFECHRTITIKLNAWWTVKDDNYDATLSNTIHNSKASKKNEANDNDMKAKNNIQRNESLDKYQSIPQRVLVLVLPGI